MKEWLKVILVFVCFIATGVASFYWISTSSCVNFSKESGLDVKYDFLHGCFVSVDGDRWLRPENIRYDVERKD